MYAACDFAAEGVRFAWRLPSVTCFHPITVFPRNSRFGHRGSGGQLVPCGRCPACRVNRAEDWTNRICWEDDEHAVSCFATLTFSDDNLPIDLSVDKRDLQLFFKRLRFALPGRKIRYFACGEYGESFGRPHYHAVLFGVSHQELRVVEDAWGLGICELSPLLRERARYVAGYLLKEVDERVDLVGRNRPFALMSKRFGAAYCERVRQVILAGERPLTVNGVPVATPRYFRRLLGGTDNFLAQQFGTTVKLNHQLRVAKEVQTTADFVMRENLVRESINRSRNAACISYVAREGLKRKQSDF